MLRPRNFTSLIFLVLIIPWAACFSEKRAIANSFASFQREGVEGSRSSALIAEGTSALEKNDVVTAKSMFLRVLAINPKSVTAHTYLGVIADREGNLAEAERHFAAAVAIDPRSASALNNYGAILVRLGRGKLAAVQFETSLKLEPNQPSALFNLAQIRFAEGGHDGLIAARALFERLESVSPQASTARSLVVISLKLGEKRATADNYRKYLEQLKLENGADKATTPAQRLELGRAFLESGLLEEAISELSAAVQAEPSNVGAIISLAGAYLQRKDIRSAGRTLETAVASGQNDARLYAALAEVYEAGGYVENAIPAMRLAIERDPKNENYRFRYGLLLTDTKAPAAAVIRLQEALKDFPNSARIWLALGIAELGTGKNEDAQKAFEHSLQLDPRSVPALAYVGNTYAERGQYADAVKYYERAISIGQRLAVPFYLAADAILKQPDADLKRVESYLTQAVIIDPKFAAARFELAKLYVRQERWAQAATELEQTLSIDPKLIEAHYLLGQTYMRLKRTDDAKRELGIFKESSDTEKVQRETERRDLVRRLADVRF